MGVARRRQARSRARPARHRRRGPCLPRCRRLDRRIHRGAARKRCTAGLCSRCRPRPAPCAAARPGGHRLARGNRYPRARSRPHRGAARRRGGRCELHLAQAGAAARARGSRPPARHLVVLVKPQFELRRSDLKRGVVRDPVASRRRLRRDRRLRGVARLRAWWRLFPRRSKAAMETANSSSERGVVDRLAIARLGQRGDGIADTADGRDLRALQPAGRDRGGAGVARPSGSPAPGAGRRAQSRQDRADLSAFRRLRRLRAPALARAELSRLET